MAVKYSSYDSSSGNVFSLVTITGATGVYTTTLSGATITGNTGAFTSGTFISLTGTTTQGTTAIYATGSFTSLTGTTTTGTTANFVSGVYTTRISGTTITGNVGAFTTITGGIITLTSGVFASGTAAAPSVSVGTTNNGLYSPDTNQVAISTNGVGRLFVDDSGRLLIGTSTDRTSASLQLEGSTSDAGSLSVFRNINASSGPFAILGKSRGSSNNSFNLVSANDILGQIYFQGTDGLSRVSAAIISCFVDGTPGTNDMPGRLVFSTTADGASSPIERLRITSDGKVGIGTSSPGERLTVAGGDIQLQGTTYTNFSDYWGSGDNAALFLPYGFLGSNGAFSVSLYANGYRNTTPGFTYMGLNGNTSTAAGLDLSPAGEIFLKTGTASGTSLPTRLFINPSGNVGIGTTSPAQPLDVMAIAANSRVLIGDSGVANVPVIKAVNSTNTGSRNLGYDAAQHRFYLDGTQVFTIGTDFVFNTGGSERARIDSSGRLLVGTSNGAVTVAGNFGSTTKQVLIQTSDIATFTGICTKSDGSGGIIALGKSRSGGIVSNNDKLGLLKFAGHDGVDYEATAAQISAEVDGTPGANDMPGRLVFSVTADGSASPTEAMRINNAGELLVGYTADNGAYKLQVNSQIFATSATIATSDGRYKENVATLDGCVDLVKALRPVSFDWKEQQDITRVDDDGNEVLVREGHNFPSGTQVGFIAQEVEEVLTDKPWLGSVIKRNVRPAVTDNDGNELAPEEEFLGIAEGNLVAVLTSALKDAIGRIESLEAEVAAIKA